MIDVVAIGKANRALRRLVPPSIEVSGHSYAQGTGADNDLNGFGRRFAELVGAPRWCIRGYAGSISCHPNRSAVGDGGYAWLYRALRPESGSGESIGPFYNSIGSTGGAPYEPRSGIHLHCHAINDIASLGPTNLRPMLEAHRAIWSRMCASKVWESNTSTSTVLALTGTWSTSSDSLGQESSGGGAKRTTTLNDLVTFTLPADVPSGRVTTFGFVVQPTDDYVVTVKQNGTTIKTVTVKGSLICDPALVSGFMGNALVVRLGISGDGITLVGGDVITATMTAKTAGGMTFDYAQIEANPADGPIIMCLLPNKLLSAGYAFYVTNSFAQAAAMNNAAIDTAKVALIGALAEFDGGSIKRTVSVDLDTSGRLGTAPNPLNFIADGLHLNNRGHGIAAEAAASDLFASGVFTPRVCSRVAGPTPMFWYPINGVTWGGAASLGPASWSNSWVNFDPKDMSGTPTQQAIRYPGYRRDEAGQVNVRGRLTPGTTATKAFTLPRGYASLINRQFPLACDTGQAFAEVRAAGNSGSDIVITYSGSPTWISLDAIRYPADI